MKELKSRLRKELQQDFNVQIMDTLSWEIQMRSIEVSYQTVTKTKMDILMKMMLITFKKMDIKTVEELSEVLLVEQLFIEDLINKMTATGILEKLQDVFVLTTSGNQQLKEGVFEHKPEDATAELIYSPCHQAFLSGEQESIEYEEQKSYRYQAEFDDWRIDSLERSTLADALKENGIEKQAGNVQLVISKIVSATLIKPIEVPCIEFHLYNKEEDLMYGRVWNTLTSEWDEVLEAQLNERERQKWREQYLKS